MNMLSALAALTLTAGSLVSAATFAGEPAGARHITVEASRPYKATGRTEGGAPIEAIEMRARVNYADLDPSIPSNAEVLRERVREASRMVCADLQRLYPETQDDQCIHKAEQSAAQQVKTAIASAQSRKSPGR